MKESDNYVKILVNTLQKQVEVLQEILKVTQEQNKIAHMSEFDELLLEETLNQKEILIANLNKLDAGFTAIYGRVKSEIKLNQEQYKKELVEVQKLIKESTDLGMLIKVLEERNREKMIQCFSNQHKKYNAKNTAATVASHYNQTMNQSKVANSYFMDKKN